MPSTKDLFTFYLKADDLKGRSHLVTIEAVAVIPVFNPRTRHNEDRLSVRFYKAKLTMLINKTHAISLEKITGTDDYSQWIGHQVIISPATTANGAGTILISRPPEAPKPAPAAKEADDDENYLDHEADDARAEAM